MLVPGVARVFKVLLDFPAVTVWWCVLEVLASSFKSILDSLGELVFGRSEELFFS